ncbi:MAG: allophanate hydrolase [Granulosicoccus sp.]
MTDIDMTLAGIKSAYASGMTPADLMANLRERAMAYSDHNVFIHLLNAEELEPWLQGLGNKDPETSTLWGVPFVLKDNIDLAGIATTAACEAFSYVPRKTAFIAQQLIDQGALPLGKANLDQFATGLNGTRSPYGACANSFDKQMVSGGSSAGSAVAVALGLASFSLGTDTAGSGRVPACFNNLVGVKPTRGLLSASGVVPACRSLDCVSIFALHCDDANHVLSVAEGFDKFDGYSRPNQFENRGQTYVKQEGPLTLGVLSQKDLRFFGYSDYETAYGQSITRIEQNGIRLVEIDYGPFDEVAKLLYEGPWVAERYLATLPLIKDNPDAIFPAVREIISKGRAPLAIDAFQSQYRLHELKQLCMQQMQPVDALLTPTAGRLFSINEMLAEPIKRNSELGYYTNFVNLLDMAAIAVPTAFTDKALPFGVTLCGPAFSDRRLLSIANRIQQLYPLPMATTRQTVPETGAISSNSTDRMELVVCGAHLDGMPLNYQLTDRGAHLLERTNTTPDYRLYALQDGPIPRPALVQSSQKGVAIEVEVWSLPAQHLGSFIADIARPLGLGKVKLADGREACGFIAEPCSVDTSIEITHLGGWKNYINQP